MAIFHVNGPATIFPGVGSNRALTFFGTSEISVEISVNPYVQGVKNDLAGAADMESAFLGEEAIISADVNRYNERVMAAMQSRPNSAGTRGIVPFGGIGSLGITEALMYPLVINAPYATKPVFAANGDPLNWAFAAVWLVGPDNWNSSTRYKKVHCVWHAIPVFNPQTLAFSLYTNTAITLPAIN